MVKTGDMARFIEPSVSWTRDPERFIWCFLEGTGNLGKFIGIFLTDEEPLLQARLVNLQNGVVDSGSTVISGQGRAGQFEAGHGFKSEPL